MVDIDIPNDKDHVEEQAELRCDNQGNAPDEINQALIVKKVDFRDKRRVCLLVENEVCRADFVEKNSSYHLEAERFALKP